MKAWLTKYALSQGVKIVEANINAGLDRATIDGYFGVFILGRDIFVSRESAALEVDRMILRRTASLNKQIQKLDKMDSVKMVPE